MGLRMFLRSGNEFAAKTELGIVLEYFCEIGKNLRLRQNLELSQNIFAKLKLDLEFFVRREERRGIGLRKSLSKSATGERELDLR